MVTLILERIRGRRTERRSVDSFPFNILVGSSEYNDGQFSEPTKIRATDRTRLLLSGIQIKIVQRSTKRDSRPKRTYVQRRAKVACKQVYTKKIETQKERGGTASPSEL